MNTEEKLQSELLQEFKDLQHEYNSMKELYEKEISILRQSEERTRISDEKFRIAYMTSPDSININRLSDGMYVSINGGFTSILGYTEKDSVGRTSLEMNIWANPDDRVKMVKEVEAKGKVKNFEAKFLAKDGNIVWGLLSASLIDLDGVPHVLTIVRDITVHKKAEDALEKEQFLINALMNNLADYVYLKDIEGRFIRINKSHSQILGLDSPDQAIGKTDFDFLPKEHSHSQQAYNDEMDVIRTGKTLNKEEEILLKDNTKIWVLATKLPLRNRDGNIIGVFGISRDITEQKKLENALLVKQLLLEGIIGNIPDQIYYKDRNSKFVLCNTPVALLAGCSSEKDLIGKSDFDFHPHDMAEQYFKDEQTLMEKGEKFLDHEEQILNKKTGELRWNLSSKVPVKDADGKVIGLAGINRDITERKKAEEEIKLKNELLQTINTEKDKFFSIIAHDLKGPLSAFLGVTQILVEEIQNMSFEEIKEITISMKESASNIYVLLENLLEWSRLKRGLLDFSPEKVDVKRLTIACIEVLKESARKKNIIIDYSFPDDIEFFADSHMMETVIRNLVSNAIKFTHVGGKVIIKADKKSDRAIEFKVIDSGIGMTSDLMNKLFLLNEKTNRKGTEGEPSTGLGLLLCKEFIMKHNGKIWVESEVGKGSIFTFMIPDLIKGEV
jgi:two-component system, sensor histidine kinase and response regulator